MSILKFTDHMNLGNTLPLFLGVEIQNLCKIESKNIGLKKNLNQCKNFAVNLKQTLL